MGEMEAHVMLCIAGDFNDYKPLVFVIRMQKRAKVKSVGRNTTKWWKCHGTRPVLTEIQWHLRLGNYDQR